MKIGDKVRFLNETGGGHVAGFKGKNMVLVEDEDGFQVPMLLSDVVVVGEESYDSSRMVAAKQLRSNSAASGKKESNQEEEAYPERPITFKPKPVERRGGDRLSAYLAFVPLQVKELSQTRFEAYFVNDSNYYLRYAYYSAEGNSWHLRFSDEVEPNTKAFVEEFGREDLGELEHVALQIIAFKREKPFALKPAIDVQLRIDGVKFYKLHTFQENDFFEQPALVYTLVENDVTVRPLSVSPDQLKKEIYARETK